MIDVFNPKVAIFFMAFLPQFVDPVLGHGPLQLFVLGTLVNLIGFVVETIAVLAVVQVVGRMKASKTVGVWLDRALGSLFIVLGVRLAIVSR